MPRGVTDSAPHLAHAMFRNVGNVRSVTMRSERKLASRRRRACVIARILWSAPGRPVPFSVLRKGWSAGRRQGLARPLGPPLRSDSPRAGFGDGVANPAPDARTSLRSEVLRLPALHSAEPEGPPRARDVSPRAAPPPAPSALETGKDRWQVTAIYSCIGGLSTRPAPRDRRAAPSGRAPVRAPQRRDRC